MNTTSQAIRAKVLVGVLNSQGQLTELWAADSDDAAQHLADNLRAYLYSDHRVEVSSLGMMIAAQLAAVAEELGKLAGGAGSSPYEQAKRQGIAACAGTVMRLAQQWSKAHL